MFDLLIRNGTIIDGTGAPACVGDVAISNGKVAAIGNLSSATNDNVDILEASGLYVTPGFIDVNSHSAYTLLVDPRGVSALYQGVTLEIVGNCGHGCFPIGDPNLATHSIYGFNNLVALDWKSGGDYLLKLETAKPGINVATLVPNGQLRTASVGFKSRPATSDELRCMKYHLIEALEAGAIGLSTGLEYPAEGGVSEEELLELCEVVHKYDGIFATHVRDRDKEAVEGVREVVRIAREAQVPLQISHLLPRGGLELANECVDEIERARSTGMPVGFDMHTRTFGTTYLKAVLPSELAGLGAKELAAALRKPSVRRRVRSHRSIISALGDWERVVLFEQPYQPEYSKRNLKEVADLRNQEVFETICDMIVQECDADDGRTLMVVMPSYDADTLYAFHKHPLCVPASNGTTMGVDGPLAGTSFHGTFTWAAFYFRCMVRDRKLMTPEEAVHRLTGLPASLLNIGRRGVLAIGSQADVAVFDPDTFRETGTLYEPSQLATGMKHVVVNGVVALRNGKLTDARGGVVVRR